ncbi:hypothetical protein P4V54_00480 [Brevibacillus nitrificans]|uniref:hypothetical protein n=1 Tax=Brevibacillus nitrificans TaxID=651560 RepID=UPI002E22FC58|nr:hypothetical protein [Brevibacillus nitrificans]
MVVQTVGSTTSATITITDSDKTIEGVVKYRIHVSIGASATEDDPYQDVSEVGSQAINLETLSPGSVDPSDGQELHFLVVAYDDAGNKSTPLSDDRATVTWDESVYTVSNSEFDLIPESGLDTNDGVLDIVSDIEFGEAVSLERLFVSPGTVVDENTPAQGYASLSNNPSGYELTSNLVWGNKWDGVPEVQFSNTSYDVYIRVRDEYGNVSSWVKIDD